MPRISRANSLATNALWTAVLEGDVEAAQTALEAGARANAQKGTKSILSRAIEGAHPALVRLLLAHGANPHGASHHLTCWERAISSGNIEMAEAFADAGVDLDAPMAGLNRLTPSGLAAEHQDAALLRWLWKRGAQVARSRVQSVGGMGIDLTLACWIEGLRPRQEPAREWWDVVDWLLDQPIPPGAQAGLGAYIPLCQSRQKGLGMELLGRIEQRRAWMEGGELAQVLHNELLYREEHEWARRVRERHRPSLGPVAEKGPWTRTPLASLLATSKQEVGRPRRLKKALARIEELLELGADPNDWQSHWPLAFWSLREDHPAQAIGLLLDHGANPILEAGTEEADEAAPWVGSSLMHMAAWWQREEAIDLLAARDRRAVRALDEQGLSPVLRAIIPRVVTTLGRRLPIVPIWRRLVANGASMADTCPETGGNAIHLLAEAIDFSVVPSDLGLALVFLHDHAPGIFEARDHKGVSGWDLLLPGAPLGSLDQARVLVRARRLSMVLPRAGQAHVKNDAEPTRDRL